MSDREKADMYGSCSNEALAGALGYSRRGWRVFPVDFEKRKPLITNPYGVSSIDENQIRAWHDQFRPLAWGLDCGNSGMCVVDLDVKNGVDGIEAWKEKGFPISGFRVSSPSGGVHIYYKGVTKNDTHGKIASGVDVKSNRGLVLIPGSFAYFKKINKEGMVEKVLGRYRILSDKAVCDVPEDVVRIVSMPSAKEEFYTEPLGPIDDERDIQRAETYLREQAPEAIAGDHGDTTTFTIACELKNRGMSRETALGLMLEVWNPEKAIPPWEPEDLRIKVDSAYNSESVPQGNKTLDAIFPGDFDDVLMNAQKDAVSKKTLIDEAFSDFQVPNDIHPDEWVLEGLLLRKGVTMIYSPGGVGKSMLTLNLAASVASGDKSFSGFDVIEKGPAWIWNMEDGHTEWRKRIGLLGQELRIPERIRRGIMYTHRPLTLVETNGYGAQVNDLIIKTIVETIKERGIKLFVVDSLVRLHNGNENSSTDMSAVTGALEKIAKEANCAVLTIHHTPKGGSAEIRKVGGCGFSHGDSNAARGSGATTFNLRITATFFPANNADVEALVMPPEEASQHIRLTVAKFNISGVKRQFYQWFKLNRAVSIAGSEVFSDYLRPIEHMEMREVTSNYLTEEQAKVLSDVLDFDVPLSINAIAKRGDVQEAFGLGKTALCNLLKKIPEQAVFHEEWLLKMREIKVKGRKTLALIKQKNGTGMSPEGERDG